MEKTNYTVTITIEEYKTLITEAVENRKDAEVEREKRWSAVSENNELKAELLETQKRVVELEAKLADLAWAEHQSAPVVTCSTEVANNG